MRCHLPLIAAAKKQKMKSLSNMDDADDHGDSVTEEQSWMEEEGKNCRENLEIEEDQDEDQDQESYALRENPKKSWKITDLRIKPCQSKEIFCKECCKKFRSLRALAGHMRSHSTKFIGKGGHNCRKCGKGFNSMRALFGHMKTHSKKFRASTEYNVLPELELYCPKKKRSATRYRTSQSSPFSSARESPSFDEMDEADKEAVMCLVMLSRGVWESDRFKSQIESSFNPHSLAYYDKENSKACAVDSLCDGYEIEEPMEKLDSCLLGLLKSVPEHNCSECFCCLDKKSESGSSFHVLLCSDKCKILQHDVASSLKLDDDKMIWNSCSQEEEHVDGINEDEQKPVDADPEIFKNPVSKREYKCKTCNLIFNSHQALGGHSNKHRMVISGSDLSTETTLWLDNQCIETPMEQGSCRMEMADFDVVRSKEHECQICFKVFPTGQALGGHKRAHYTGATEDITEDIMVVTQDIGDCQVYLDLNIPVIPHQGASIGVDNNNNTQALFPLLGASDRGVDDAELSLKWTGCVHQSQPMVMSS